MAQQNATRDQWLRSRLELLKREKELTQLREAIAQERRNLPRVLIDTEYHFIG